MKKIVFALFLVMALLAAGSVSAHETRVYRIGDQQFQLVVGSLNEPVAVDDKTGVSLSVMRVGAGAVEGLDQTLKVEVSAGDQKKVLDLAPVHGEAGAYKADFIPTVQTTYTYRFFGEVNNTPVDLPFFCNPAGHPASPEDTNSVALSDGVTQTLKRGAFGCPVARADLGFPEEASTYVDVRNDIGSSKTTGMAALGLSAVALVLAIRRRS